MIFSYGANSTILQEDAEGLYELLFRIHAVLHVHKDGSVVGWGVALWGDTWKCIVTI